MSSCPDDVREWLRYVLADVERERRRQRLQRERLALAIHLAEVERQLEAVPPTVTARNSGSD